MTTCSHCGRENPGGARFCNSCGMPLNAETEPAREVRKTVTVLFCDVVGSTELGERLDPELLRGVMARFYDAAREPVRRHGGTVEKVIGDALVAVFGTPVVHEDDALRAVRAALEMRDAVTALGDVQARIGVNTGDVLAGDATAGEALVVGDAVNTAARLEQAAAPGVVLVGEATWVLVAHAAHGERVEPVAAKGKREPLVAWRLDGVDPRAGGHRRRLDLPMVGRETELGLLRLAVERTEQAERPHLVTVLGQPGIGKSRLVSELPRLADGIPVLTGQCRATASSLVLEPLLEAVRGLMPDDPGAAEGIAALMPGDPDARAVAACLAPGGAAGVPDIAWALSRLIGSTASAHTVVILLEDVHWADDVLLDVVEQLVGHGRRHSLLVVCTARPEFAERRAGWGTGANTLSVALERLDDGQTRRLLTRASPDLAADQVERVVAAVEGNPLFAEHLAALMEDHDPSAGLLPRSIQVLLSARLEALPEPEREVVSAAAVAGRDFDEDAAEALVGRPIAVELDHLAQRELIEPTTAGRRQFGHALLQEAAYGLIPKQRRIELHTLLARWLDDHGAGDAVVGDHLERAFSLLTELGRVDGATARLGEEAGTRLAAAGRRADAMGDPQRARLLLERALELLPDTSPGRAGAMIELAAAAWNLLPQDELDRLVATGADLAAQHGLRALELRARLLRFGVDAETTPNLSADERLAQTRAALRELDALGDPRALAAALCTLANLEGSLGRAADALAHARRATDVLRAADEDTVWAVSNLVEAAVESPLPVPEAETLLSRLMDEVGVRPTVRLELMLGQAPLALMRGQTDEAWKLMDTVREIERDLGRNTAWRVSQAHGELLARAGRLEEARSVLARVVAERYGRSSADLARSWLGLVQVRLGNLDDARTGAIPGVGYVTRTREHLMFSELHLGEGDVEGAVRSARDAVAVADGGDWVLLRAEAHLALARALSVAGDSEAAAAQAQAAAGLYTVKGAVTGIAEAEALLESVVHDG